MIKNFRSSIWIVNQHFSISALENRRSSNKKRLNDSLLSRDIDASPSSSCKQTRMRVITPPFIRFNSKFSLIFSSFTLRIYTSYSLREYSSIFVFVNIHGNYVRYILSWLYLVILSYLNRISQQLGTCIVRVG